jgi:hypothetical protein
MVSDSGLATDLKPFNVAYLLDRPVILLNLPMSIVLFGKALTA